MTQLFVDKALEVSYFFRPITPLMPPQLGEVWARQAPDESGWAHINVLAGLKAMTLDVIGLAGTSTPGTI
jgi:hypothetical protein